MFLISAPQEKYSLNRILTIVFVLSFYILLLELVLSRMAVFYLNYANSFLAIPLTLFGLALGSIRVHLSKNSIESYEFFKDLLRLVGVSLVVFLLVFLMFSSFFPITNRGDLTSWLIIVKTIAFILLFLPIFYYVGKILSISFLIYKESIGKLYAADLAGAAIACFLAPICFHFLDLPYIVFIGLLAIGAATLLAGDFKKKKVVLLSLSFFVLMLPLMIFFESSYDIRQIVDKVKDTTKVEELVHRWNEFSRVSLVKITEQNKRPYHMIYHDAAESKVWTLPYDPLKRQPLDLERLYYKDIQIPFLLNRNTEDVLVMFAGCGKQLIEFDYFGGGQNSLVGVELNPLVKKIAVTADDLQGYRFQEFYNLPNVNLNIQEGRSFLDNNPHRYDVIYLASNMPTSEYKTDNSRKYLETVETMESYLDHLKKDGLLIAHCQPSLHKIESLKKVFKDRGWGSIEKNIVFISTYLNGCDTLIFSLSPFKDGEVGEIIDHYGRYQRHIRYAPGQLHSTKKVKKMIQSDEIDSEILVTDDRPFIFQFKFSDYSLFPEKVNRRWVKLTSLLVVSLAIVLILLSLYCSRFKMPPVPIALYLTLSGFCYMIIEIIFMSKLELFLENPLYSMALLLSVFLLANAVGSFIYGKMRAQVNMLIIPIITLVVLFFSFTLIDGVIAYKLGLPLVLKILITILLISPCAICLGFFYPSAVVWLYENNQPETIPVTYAVSTLSSVLGATYTMIVMVNFGYSHMIVQAGAGYVLIILLVVSFRKRLL